jgi:RNA polymerase sigma factor (sigma-70 family)
MPGSFDHDRFRQLLRSHPESAINLLAKRYWTMLVGISKGFTNDVNSAHDIVQETFAHVWEKHKVLSQEHEKTIDNYLIQVVRYKSITHFKKTIKISDLKRKYLDDQSVSDSSVETSIIKDEIVASIRSLIATFPKRERECLELKIDRELTNSEIAYHLNVTPKAVERSITSAYKRLRKSTSIYP